MENCVKVAMRILLGLTLELHIADVQLNGLPASISVGLVRIHDIHPIADLALRSESAERKSNGIQNDRRVGVMLQTIFGIRQAQLQ